jgi:creatinine amidohydrolase/Fe(II)-dependent formamide hydrolase-like protein
MPSPVFRFVVVLLALCFGPARANTTAGIAADTIANTVFVAEMTWPEVRDALARGTRTVIVPTGGIEQGGPHLVIGKHNHIVRPTANAVAMALGDALVAPVVVYTPQGAIAPPSGHMRYPGTVSMPEAVFRAVLENIARSFKAHGFTQILLLGDSGGNQKSQQAVADNLNREWAGGAARVLHVADYYDPERNGQFAWLRANGREAAAGPGHADLRDSAELMAVYPGGVRRSKIGNKGEPGDEQGVMGDPSGATAPLGQIFLRLKIQAALGQIKRWRKAF